MIKRLGYRVCGGANAPPRVLLESQLMPIKPNIYTSQECMTLQDEEDGRQQSIVFVPSSPLAEPQVSLFNFSLTARLGRGYRALCAWRFYRIGLCIRHGSIQ